MGDRRHPASWTVKQLLAECEVTRLRRSGPGGQHRNKVETAIRLKHSSAGIAVEAGERRSQRENLSSAVRRLRLELALHVRCIPAPRPSDLWQRRCVNARLVIRPEHDDFPALLAEALDVLADSEWEARRAGERLGCTSSQLIRLLSHQPQALALVNRRRVAGGKKPYW